MDILIPAWIDGQLQPVEKLQTHLRGLRHTSLYAKTLLKTGGLSLETAAEPAVIARATPAFARSS